MKKGLIYAFLLLTLFSRAQHYPAFSQYIINGLAINPAYAGRNGVLDITAAHRRQWMGFNGSPVTSSFNMNSPLRVKSISLGLSVVDDKFGPINNQLVNAIYAYRVRMGKFRLSFGLQNGVTIKKVNYDNLIRNDQTDALINGQRILNVGFISGAGLYLHSKNMFAGISAPYLVNTLNPNFLFENPFLATGGYYIELNKEHGLKPSVLVKYVKNSPVEADFNLNYYYMQHFGIGVSYRTNRSVIGIAEFGINNQLKICYSYDCELNRLKKVQSGSHELLLRYYFGYGINAKNPREMHL